MNRTLVCPICDHRGIEFHVRTADYLLGRSEVAVDFMRCKRCGLFFQSPEHAAPDFTEGYPPGYAQFFADLHSDQAEFNSEGRLDRGTLRQIGYLTRFIQEGRILEIGSGSGKFLDGLKRTGRWEVVGVEPDPVSADLSRSRGLEGIIEAPLETTDFDSESFDSVVLWDVFEHLRDPGAALQKIRQILKPGGWLLIRVPNAGSWEASLFGKAWAGWDSPRHFSAFTSDSLLYALDLAGFIPIAELGGAEDFSSFEISVRFWLRSRAGDRHEPHWLERSIRHPAVRAMAYPLFWISGRTSYRSRLTSVAQKPDRSHMQEAP